MMFKNMKSVSASTQEARTYTKRASCGMRLKESASRSAESHAMEQPISQDERPGTAFLAPELAPNTKVVYAGHSPGILGKPPQGSKKPKPGQAANTKMAHTPPTKHGRKQASQP